MLFLMPQNRIKTCEYLGFWWPISLSKLRLLISSDFHSVSKEKGSRCFNSHRTSKQFIQACRAVTNSLDKKTQLTVGVRRLSFGLTVLLVVPEISRTVTNSLQANTALYSSQHFHTWPHPERWHVQTDSRLTCSPGTPPTDTSPPASSTSLPAPPLCSWGHAEATKTTGADD